jgi:hypothetical protein
MTDDRNFVTRGKKKRSSGLQRGIDHACSGMLNVVAYSSHWTRQRRQVVFSGSLSRVRHVNGSYLQQGLSTVIFWYQKLMLNPEY